MALAASVQAQPVTPRPHPEPVPPAVKVDRTPPPLMPVETVWGLALNNPLIMPPAYDASMVFFPIEGDRLVAYDLMSGEQKWLTPASPVQPPAAGDGLVFLLEAAALKALRAGDGSVAWELPFADKLATRPVWDNGWLILAAASGEVRAYRATDGQLIWRRDLKSPAHAPPALAADRVYVPTTDGRIVALRVESGEPLWERRLGGAPNDILALDTRLYAGSQDNFFYCLLAADGKIDWRWRTGGDIIGQAVADQRHVYFVALDNVLRAMNLVTGGLQWMRPLPMRPAFGPVRAGSTIVVGGQAPPLRAYNIKDGVAAGTLTGVSPQTAEAIEKAAEEDYDDDGELIKKKPLTFNALADAEVAAPPYFMTQPVTHTPLMVLLFREIAKGASATLVIHSVEPTLIPAVAQLPNLIQIAPVAPTTPPPRP